MFKAKGVRNYNKLVYTIFDEINKVIIVVVMFPTIINICAKFHSNLSGCSVYIP